MAMKKAPQSPKRSRSDLREAKIIERCEGLFNVVQSIRPLYDNANAGQRAFLETMIGAALWYISKPTNAWTGYISENAIRSYHPKTKGSPKLSEEHVHPRKQAAIKLLHHDALNGTILAELFNSKFGRVHYLTPAENKAVARYQRSGVFVSSEETYRVTNIRLIQVSHDNLRQIKARNAQAIETVLESAQVD